MRTADAGEQRPQARASVDLYDTSYDNFTTGVLAKVRAATYGEDLGQSSWMTADELRQFISWLELKRSDHLLEVGSGSGGSALFITETIGCQATGVDINEHGIRNANALAQKRRLEKLTHFQMVDASASLPFEDNAFDAILSNDAMCHIPGRADVLKDWFRVLKPGGRMLYTDAMVITGLVSHEEIATRSSIGTYFFLPPGENERLIRGSGFELVRTDDLTGGALAVAKRWHDARAQHKDDLLQIEGAENFDGLQKFLFCVYTLSAERRLCRYGYVGRKAFDMTLLRSGY